MPPQLVYKFLGPSRAGILHEGTIRYTQPGALNDPFELRPYFELLVPERQLIEGALTTRVNISEELRIAYDTLPPDKRAHFSLDDFAAFNAVYGRYFTAAPPGRSTVQAARLPLGVLVEVDCIAVAGD